MSVILHGGAVNSMVVIGQEVHASVRAVFASSSYPPLSAMVPGVAVDADMSIYNYRDEPQASPNYVSLIRGYAPVPLLSAVSSDARVVPTLVPGDPSSRELRPSADVIAAGVPVSFETTLTLEHAGGFISVDASYSFTGSRKMYQPLEFHPGNPHRLMNDLLELYLGSTVRTLDNAREFEANPALKIGDPTTWHLARRNTNNVLHGLVDFGSFAHLASGGIAATLVSPRHVVSAAHWGATAGVKLGFLSDDNVLQIATVLRHGGVSGVSDGLCSYLDTPITNVTPASILAARTPWSARMASATEGVSGWSDYVPGSAIFSMTQRSLLPAEDRIRKLGVEAFGSASISNQGVLYRPTAGGWITYIMSEDSGSQMFTQISGKTVLITQLANIGGGSNWAGNISALNGRMNLLKDASDTTVYAVDTVSV